MSKRKISGEVVAVASTSEVRKMQKCHFCKAESTDGKTIFKMRNSYSEAFICSGCEKEEKFPIVKLKEMLKEVDLFWTMDDVAIIKSKDFDGPDAPVGFLELNQCRICVNVIKRHQKFENHNQQAHPGFPLGKCSHLCGEYFPAPAGVKFHQFSCVLICPYENCDVAKFTLTNNRDDEHLKKHPMYFCPSVGCKEGFKKNGLEWFAGHFLNDHVWLIKK
ncbi:Hypothetical predicted protein [Cloeon dipterum]|uniref:Uncharacterized protein n=1 Tax=Cloeon dipterum TaxID=197152 RepID=A0A8S1DKF1_9INSE|nr:Hypothetical predicted protein [Cloeon dipterum]